MREAYVERKTKETDINLKLCLDGGQICVNTGIGFFDHMLETFAKHSGFGLTVNVKGDLKVDCHHTVEDTGIVLGMAFAQAVADKKGIARYGTSFIPMDESLAFACVDIGGRPFCVFEAEMPQEVIGEYDSCITAEFMRAFAYNALVTLHVVGEYGDNAHHLTEAMFKAVAHSLKDAVKVDGDEVLSTKGVI
ncbi:MAG: imidazoleglycerol-phosphate dehydratase HisB [bacterium]|nr:imidazoleglycerol-phosphate dehydratase HisB [bacterium]